LFQNGGLVSNKVCFHQLSNYDVSLNFLFTAQLNQVVNIQRKRMSGLRQVVAYSSKEVFFLRQYIICISCLQKGDVFSASKISSEIENKILQEEGFVNPCSVYYKDKDSSEGPFQLADQVTPADAPSTDLIGNLIDPVNGKLTTY
jgi:hypothetical protein